MWTVQYSESHINKYNLLKGGYGENRVIELGPKELRTDHTLLHATWSSLHNPRENIASACLLLRDHICRQEAMPQGQYPKAIGRMNSHSSTEETSALKLRLENSLEEYLGHGFWVYSASNLFLMPFNFALS